MSDEIVKIQEKIVPILKEAGVLRSSIFGSVARGEATAESDVDILVDLPDGKSLFDLVRLERKLEGAINKKVDLITYYSINPLLKNAILKEQIPIL